ncbi:hypothetical protein JG688_00014041 [Phytophthora aleatoria]|uniref:Uncharacterized protein n=1 Tax=Phytophthora aleatoria TaxID=2496075 RepID=A0A8J5LXT6_9STRA|nr:hypothetical protein JG688_00014041 [Phytophthora aleatoria]
MTANYFVEQQTYLDDRDLVVTTSGRTQVQHVARRLDDVFADAADAEKKTHIRTATTKEQQKVNTLLAKWIARHFRPMIIVEDKGFVELFHFITHDLGRVSLLLSKRTQLRNDIVALAVYYRTRVKSDIERCCVYFSMPSDVWTERDG